MEDFNENHEILPAVTLDDGIVEHDQALIVADGRVFFDLDAVSLVLHQDVHMQMSMAEILPPEVHAVIGIESADYLRGAHDATIRLHQMVEAARAENGLEPLFPNDQPDGPPTENPDEVSLLEAMFAAGSDEDHEA